MIAAPADGGSTHLQALAKLSALLMDEGFRQDLLNAKTSEEFLSKIDKKEAEKDAEEATIWGEKKKIRELLRNEERLSTLRVVYYILTK